MGEVMRKAVQVDDDQFCKVQEKLAQLEVRWLLLEVHPSVPLLLISLIHHFLHSSYRSHNMSSLYYHYSVLIFSFLQECLKSGSCGARL